MTAGNPSGQGGPRPKPWLWALLCLAQAGFYVVELAVFSFALWGAYGDGDPAVQNVHAAGSVVIGFGVVAAGAAGVLGTVAHASRQRQMKIGQFALAGVILAVTGIWAGFLISA